jgi:hypothetical protein
VSESLKAALVSYRETPGLTPVDSAHLQRWSDDDRADEVWLTIERAAQEHELAVPPHVFIREILAIRRVAKAIASRGKYRDRYHTYAKQMEKIAKFLREPHPLGMPPTLPGSEKLARMLDAAARVYRREVDPSRAVPDVVKVTRESDTPAVFMNQTSNYLKGITGQWLDDQVAVLTEIAFKKIGDVESEQVKRFRRNIKRRSASRAAES